METQTPATHHQEPPILLRVDETCKGCAYRKVLDGALQCTNRRTVDLLTNTRCNHYEERE